MQQSQYNYQNQPIIKTDSNSCLAALLSDDAWKQICP